MKEIRIKICKDTRQVTLPKNFFAVNGENLQSKLIFEFTDEFVDGQARIEYQPLFGEKMYQMLNKEDNTYTIPLKSTLTGTSRVDLNLVITEGTEENEIPKFVSKMFYFNIDPAVNAEIEQPDEYPTWIEMANAKLNAMDEALRQVDNLDIDVSQQDNITTVTITKKDGTTKSADIESGGGGGTTYTAGTNIEISDKNVISAPLENYYNQADVNNLLLEKQDKLIAGDNITIDENNVISATGGGSPSGNYVTIDTNQTITGEKKYTSQVKIQNGSAAGALVIGADSGQTTMTAGNRKLGRMSFPLQEYAGTRNCAFASCDTLNTEGQSPINCVEFGGRVGDTTTTSPDELNFTVARVHNTTSNSQKIRALQIKKDAARFIIPVYYNNSQLENMGNKVTSISSSSTNTQYPSAKAVYDSFSPKANITETGNKIDLEIDSTTYTLVAKLYDKNNSLISTSSEIDLPLESMVIDAEYDSVNRSIILTLTNGVTVSVSVADLVSGLISDGDLEQALLTKQDVLTAGDNITIENGVISATDVTYDVATENTDGLMSSADKIKLDGIEVGAEINEISSIEVNGVAQPIESKIVNISVSEDKNYVFEQAVPSNTWNINHNLGKYPAVMVMDSSNNEVIGEIQYTDLNNIVISFNGVFSGKVTLN